MTIIIISEVRWVPDQKPPGGFYYTAKLILVMAGEAHSNGI